MKLNFKAAPILIALLLPATLGACTAGNAKLNPVALPAAPECMAPVPVPKAKAGDDARLALKKTHAALGQANGRLVCSRNWYNGVRKSYSPSQ